MAESSGTSQAQSAGFFTLAKRTFKEWKADEAPDMAAALAYYTFLSIAPLLVIALAVAAMVFGPEAAKGELVHQLENFMGPQAAEAVQSLLERVHTSGNSMAATALSILALLVSSTSLVEHLKKGLNRMWNVEEKPGQGIMGIIKDRLFALLLILGIGALLLVSIAASIFVSGATDWIESNLVTLPPIALRLIELGVSAAVITLLFAMIYKWLPDVKIGWTNVWIGAIATALLFVLGKYLVGLYLGRSSVASGYGAAGSLVILLIWIYYSSLILFLGAEFTQVYAKRRGEPVLPSEKAMPADSPEAQARKPRVEKAVKSQTGPAGATTSHGSSTTSTAPPGAQAREKSGTDQLTVRIPAAPAKGSLVTGVVSFIGVTAASRLLGRKGKHQRSS